MNKRKVPLRKCIACGESKQKKELLRVVKNKEEGIMVDLTGKKNGRGAYICQNIECLNNVIKNKKLSRVLETEIPDVVYEKLKKVIDNK